MRTFSGSSAPWLRQIRTLLSGRVMSTVPVDGTVSVSVIGVRSSDSGGGSWGSVVRVRGGAGTRRPEADGQLVEPAQDEPVAVGPAQLVTRDREAELGEPGQQRGERDAALEPGE